MMSIHENCEGSIDFSMTASIIEKGFYDIISDEDEKISETVKEIFSEIAKIFAHEKFELNDLTDASLLRVSKIIARPQYDIEQLNLPKLIDEFVRDGDDPEFRFFTAVLMIFLACVSHIKNENSHSDLVREKLRKLFKKCSPQTKELAFVRELINLAKETESSTIENIDQLAG